MGLADIATSHSFLVVVEEGCGISSKDVWYACFIDIKRLRIFRVSSVLACRFCVSILNVVMIIYDFLFQEKDKPAMVHNLFSTEL